MTRLEALALVLLTTVACFQLPDDWVDNDITRALDYHVDRPRVLAVTLHPTVLQPGEPTTIDALIVAPDGARPSEVSVASCGLDSEVPVAVFGLSCFDNPELVDPIGVGLPQEWTVPDLNLDCAYEDTGVGRDSGWAWDPCASQVPLRVEALFEDGRAYGHIEIELGKDGSRRFGPKPLADLPQQLEVSGEAIAGGTVELEMRITESRDIVDVHWYVDAGELLGTGRTLLVEQDDTWQVATNRLRIPEGYEGDLRVWAVIAREGFSRNHGDATWREDTLSVERSP